MNITRQSIISVLIVLLITLVGMGCTSRMLINVNAIADKDLSLQGKQYVINSDMPEVDEQDLFFKEFSGYFNAILTAQGFNRVDDANKADFVVKFKYAVSDGRTGFYTYRTPVYEILGGYTYTITINTVDASGNVVPATKHIHIPPQLTYVGSETEMHSYTLYNRTVTLRAIAPAKQDQPEKTLWHIQVNNVSEDSDLRQAMPYFAYAARDFLGKNTTQQQSVELELSDPGVAALKQNP